MYLFLIFYFNSIKCKSKLGANMIIWQCNNKLVRRYGFYHCQFNCREFCCSRSYPTQYWVRLFVFTLQILLKCTLKIFLILWWYQYRYTHTVHEQLYTYRSDGQTVVRSGLIVYWTGSRLYTAELGSSLFQIAKSLMAI